MEFSGVLSSWATEEKKILLIFWDCASNSLILVMSLQIAMTCCPLLIDYMRTWIYFLGDLARNMLSLPKLSPYLCSSELDNFC